MRSLAFFFILTVMVIAAVEGSDQAVNRNILKKGDTYSEDINLSFSAKPGMRVTIKHSRGDVEIRPGTDDKIVISGTKSVSGPDGEKARELLRALKIKVEED